MRTSGEIAARFQVSTLNGSGKMASMLGRSVEIGAVARVDVAHAVGAVRAHLVMEQELAAGLQVVAARARCTRA